MPKATVMAMTLLPTMLLAAHLDARVTAAQTFVATAGVKTAARALAPAAKLKIAENGALGRGRLRNVGCSPDRDCHQVG